MTTVEASREQERHARRYYHECEQDLQRAQERLHNMVASQVTMLNYSQAVEFPSLAVRFTQESCSPRFRGRSQNYPMSVLETARALLTEHLEGAACLLSTIPRIEVVWHRANGRSKGYFFSLDNRRLAAFRLVALGVQLASNIPARAIFSGC